MNWYQKAKRKRVEEELERLNGLGTKQPEPVQEVKVKGEHPEPIPSSILSMVSPPWVEEGEAVCPETNLVYNDKLPTSPHVDLDSYRLITA